MSDYFYGLGVILEEIEFSSIDPEGWWLLAFDIANEENQ